MQVLQKCGEQTSSTKVTGEVKAGEREVKDLKKKDKQLDKEMKEAAVDESQCLRGKQPKPRVLDGSAEI